MPRWDHVCPDCGAKVDDSVEREEFCPTCALPMVRLPAAPNFQLRGTGFHVNDYGRYGPKDHQ